MEVRLVRHATLLVDVAGQRLLVDPMLDPAGALACATCNERRVRLRPARTSLSG